MIVFFAPGGRLGNQLFALSFLEHARNGSEWIVSTNLGQALRCLRGMRRYLNSDHRAMTLLVDRIIRPVFRDLLSRFRVISSYAEQDDGTISRGKGILPVLYIQGYYQNADVSERRSRNLELKKCHLKAAGAVLDQAGGRTPLFVHIRRSDYLGYWVQGKIDPSLPISYYSEALDVLRKSIADPFFFFLGDEPEWASRAFPDLPKACSRRRPAAVDLALMSLCRGGVVSNSTFAWWGAYLCRGGSPIVAPRYWLGWRSSSWYPPRIETRAFLYIDVEAARV
jgi:Glycosyl transferase family 11